MRGKRCIITGATSGIGKAAALALGRMGAELILVGRDEKAGAAVARKIQSSNRGGTGTFIRADLSVRKGVTELAARISQRWDRIDVLINNAGARFNHYRPSVDGLELTFATNHLGHFLLTALVLERLVSAPGSRVITVASSAHTAVRSPVQWCPGSEHYDRKLAYGGSKLANLVFAYELARRIEGTSVTSNAVDPGGVATNLGRNNGLLPWFKHLGYYALKRQLISPRQGADTIVHLASSPTVQGISGGYFCERRPIESSELSRQGTVTADLWALSVRLTGLDESLGAAWAHFKP